MLVCVSPHPDDAALSCGGLLARQKSLGQPAWVVTVCAGAAPAWERLSHFAREQHHAWGDLADPMAQRRQEDTCALGILGCAAVWWDYLDAIYRHPAYDSEAHLFSLSADETPLEEELRARCLALPGDPLLFPLAIGHHVDHQLLFRVGWVLSQAGRRVAFYEDRPYVAWEGGPVGRLTELGRPLFPQVVETTPFWPLQAQAISCYTSQFATLTKNGVPLLEALETYARTILPGGYAERLWWPEEDSGVHQPR